MMRISGRGTDGTAKAIMTDNSGRIVSNNFREAYELMTSTDGLLLKAGSMYGFYLDNPPMEFILSGLITNEGVSKIDISFHDAVGEKTIFDDYRTYLTKNNIFTTASHKSRSNRIRIMLRNTGTSDITISKLTVVSYNGNNTETDVISTYEYGHSDLFNYDTSGNVISAKSQKIMKTITKDYSRVLMYLEHNFEVGFNINIYDILDGTQALITAGFDGEKFTSGTWSAPIRVPASSVNGTNYTVRYPIHIANEIFNYPILKLETRLVPSAVQTRKLTDSGENYSVKLKIMGVK